MATNLQRVDQNLQVIRQIEGAWSLPKLPEQVALDLAGNNIMEPAVLQDLLTGLDEDLQEAQRREPFPTRDTVGAMDVVPAKPQLEIPAGQVTVGTVIAGITGLDAPTVLDPLAVQRLKQRLVNEGYLDLTEAEVASPRWLPEYSYAAAQHSFDQLSKQFQGEKPGSISGEQILGLVDEWLSPRGLYKAAVELDLWWDWDKVKSDWGTWDARLKAWREDPWNVRKL